MKKRHWILVILMLLIYAINNMDKSVIGVVAEPIMKEFSLTPLEWGVVGSSFFWVFTVVGGLGGALADRFNTKRLLILLCIAWGIVQLGQAFIQSFSMLVAARILLGAFEGPFFAIAIVHLTNRVPAEMRSRAISIFQYGSSLGTYVAIPFLVYLTAIWSWRGTFLFLAAVSVVWTILFLAFRSDKIVAGNETATSMEPASDAVKASFQETVSVILSPTFLICCVGAFSAYWISGWASTWLPIYLIEGLGQSRVAMGNSIMVAGLLCGLVVVIYAWIADKRYQRVQSFKKAHCFVLGISLFISSAALLSLTYVHSGLYFIFAYPLTGGAAVFTFNIVAQIVGKLLPSRKGLLTGIALAFGGLGATIGPLATGYVVQMAGNSPLAGFNASLNLMLVLYLISGILFFVFADPDKKKRLSPDTVN